MPNWVYVDYWVEGDMEQLDNLYLTMKGLEDRQESLIENDFGRTWLGNLLALLGGDPLEMNCRGKWYSLYRSEETLSFSVQSAWDEMAEIRQFLEKYFPGIKILFQCTGDGIWFTNDKEWQYSYRYYLYTEETGEDFYSTLEELIAEVELVTGNDGLQTLEDCEQALIRHNDLDNSWDFYIGEFDIIE